MYIQVKFSVLCTVWVVWMGNVPHRKNTWSLVSGATWVGSRNMVLGGGSMSLGVGFQSSQSQCTYSEFFTQHVCGWTWFQPATATCCHASPDIMDSPSRTISPKNRFCIYHSNRQGTNKSILCLCNHTGALCPWQTRKRSYTSRMSLIFFSIYNFTQWSEVTQSNTIQDIQ